MNSSLNPSSAQDDASDDINNQHLQAVHSACPLIPQPPQTLSLLHQPQLLGGLRRCYLAHLPTNLIRTLATYNTLADLRSLAMTCKRLSQLPNDKYIVGSNTMMRMWKNFVLSKMEKLYKRLIWIKIYETVKWRIVHINPATRSFYALGSSRIMEGVFVRHNNSLKVIKYRPNISHVSAVDVAGETIVCANTYQLVLSRPAHEPSLFWLDRQPTIALRFLGQRKLIVVLRLKAIEVFCCERSLAALHAIQTNSALRLLYVPDAEKRVFATVDKNNTVSSYTIRGPLCAQLYSGQHCSKSPIKAIWMHREVYADSQVDFLIIWRTNAQLMVNTVDLGNYLYVRLQEKKLVCLSDCGYYAKIFEIDDKTRGFQLQQSLGLQSMPYPPSIVLLLEHIAVLMYPDSMVWAIQEGNRLIPKYTEDIKGCTPESVREYGHYLLVQGQFRLQSGVESKWCAVTNFTENGGYLRPDLEWEATH